MAQQPELYTVTQACALVKGKTSNIYTDNRYALRIAHSFGMFWKRHGFRTSSRYEMLNGPFVQELLDVILLPATLATIKIPGHSKLDSLEAQENHFADISIRNATLKGTKSNQISVTIQRNISPNDNLGN